jgi:hypothetical protein
MTAVARSLPDDLLSAADSGTTDEALAILMASPDTKVRVALAHRPYLGGLAELASDRDVLVRVAVAKQRATPVEILRVLAGDADVKVRKAVHGNRSAPDEVKTIAVLIGI